MAPTTQTIDAPMACRARWFPLKARYCAMAANRKAVAVLGFMRIKLGKTVIKGSKPMIQPVNTPVHIAPNMPAATAGTDFA